MDLERFLKLVDTSDAELAAAISVPRSTVFRIRSRRVTPSAETALKILRWAEKKAREHRLPVRDRLTFEALVERAA